MGASPPVPPLSPLSIAAPEQISDASAQALYDSWREAETAARSARSEALAGLCHQPGLPTIFEQLGPPREIYHSDILLPLAAFLTKQGQWADVLRQDVPLNHYSGGPVKLIHGPGVVVELPETVAYLLARMSRDLDHSEPLDLKIVKRVWKLVQQDGLNPELLEFYLGDGKNTFPDDLSWMGDCPLDLFLSNWPKIRKHLLREQEKERLFQQRNRGLRRDWLDGFPLWFKEKMEPYRANPVVDPQQPETILFQVAWLLEQPARKDETKRKWGTAVNKMLFTLPYLYHYLRTRLDLDWLCDLDGTRSRFLEKRFRRQYEEAVQRQALAEQAAREERIAQGLETDTPPSAHAETGTGEVSSPWDRRLDLDGIFELCATPGQVALIGGVTGHGKTVFVSQLAARLVMQSRPVLMILTDTEGPNDICRRFCSNRLNLDASDVRMRWVENGGVFPEEWRKQAAWAEFEPAMVKNLRFWDWTLGRGDITANLDKEIRSLAEGGFDPKIVIIDDLESGVPSQDRKQQAVLRAAAVIQAHVQAHQRAMVVTAQVNVVRTTNVREILPSQLSEYKRIIDHADTWVGLSNMLDADPARLGRPNQLQYLTVQRKDKKPEVVEVGQHFKYQRFEPRTADWMRGMRQEG